MPTGYTAGIKDGETFEEFVWNCARGFGALILMRDEPSDAPIPKFAPCDYNANQLKSAQSRLARLEKMSLSEAAAEAKTAYQNEVQANKRYQDESDALKVKYQKMLRKVEAWNPPTPDHQGLKKFMAEQIGDSIKFDCHDYTVNAPVLQTPKAWLAGQIANAKRDIAYHTKEQAEEVERTNSRNQWVEALDKSVRRPDKLKP